jgi:adenylate cyclase
MRSAAPGLHGEIGNSGVSAGYARFAGPVCRSWRLPRDSWVCLRCFLISRSIADPLQEVIAAMADVERGRIGTKVRVYERSQIGRLQSGFNNMVSGLAERDMLRDLFGRYVGSDVARRAIQQGASLSGDVADAAVLFIDLVGSTQFAADHSPHEVAQVLNDFFGIVVSEVDRRHGLINKFQGDAALAIFGVPLPSKDAASEALATARALGTKMRRLTVVDFGIGVSAGLVFAGNIGAENRYEYTVIGDAVNEAARLADIAKTTERRILCSAASVDRTDTEERRHWSGYGEAVLRGRAQATPLFIPVNLDATLGAEAAVRGARAPTYKSIDNRGWGANPEPGPTGHR